MGKTISELLRDADLCIGEKVASLQKEASAPAEVGSEVKELLLELQKDGVEKTAGEASGDSFKLRMIESLAIAETMANLPTLAKFAAFQQQAEKQGLGQEKVAQFLEKKAAEFKMVSILDMIPWIAKA